MVLLTNFSGDPEVLNRAVVQANIPIGGIVQRQANLEQLFFQLTGGQA